MSNTKYVGMDVHQSSISIAVLDQAGRLWTETVIETNVDQIREVFKRLSGEVYVTLSGRDDGGVAV